jgi:hypothetical protein
MDLRSKLSQDFFSMCFAHNIELHNLQLFSVTSTSFILYFIASVVQWKEICPSRGRPEFHSLFLFLVDEIEAAKLRWGGGAQRTVFGVKESKKTSARTRGQNPLLIDIICTKRNKGNVYWNHSSFYIPCTRTAGILIYVFSFVPPTFPPLMAP